MYVFIDFEFNQWLETLPKENVKFFNEIIQIGAVKTDVSGNVISTYATNVKPFNYPYVSYSISQLTNIMQEDVEYAPYFKDIVEDFYAWCEDATHLIVWGKDSTLFNAQCTDYGLENKLLGKFFNYQDVIKKRHSTSNVCSLEVVSQHLYGKDLTHNALEDATVLFEWVKSMGMENIFNVDKESPTIHLLITDGNNNKKPVKVLNSIKTNKFGMVIENVKTFIPQKDTEKHVAFMNKYKNTYLSNALNFKDKYTEKYFRKYFKNMKVAK